MSRESRTDLSASGHCKENDTTPPPKKKQMPSRSIYAWNQIYLFSFTIHLSQMYPNVQVNIRPKRMRCPRPHGNIQRECRNPETLNSKRSTLCGWYASFVSKYIYIYINILYYIILYYIIYYIILYYIIYYIILYYIIWYYMILYYIILYYIIHGCYGGWNLKFPSWREGFFIDINCFVRIWHIHYTSGS